MIAMSGGVDSSVAAYIISQQGYETAGATMKLHSDDTEAQKEASCCSSEDIEIARSVAEKLGMPYYVFNYSDNFKLHVISRFVDAYRNARTPNPCIDCNRYIKFDQLIIARLSLSLITLLRDIMRLPNTTKKADVTF